ncbi:MAG: hypothetical protein WD114_06165, partial [Phycisphaerales bacterium]
PPGGGGPLGGGTKYSSRVTPPFMLEEACHRNFAFTMFHAGNMPQLSCKWAGIKELGGGLWEITLEIENARIIPTRLEIAARNKIGLPDLLTIEGPRVVLSGVVSDRFDHSMRPTDHRPDRLLVEEGIPGEGHGTFRFLVEGSAGDEVTVSYQAEKARDIRFGFTLEEIELTPAD